MSNVLFLRTQTSTEAVSKGFFLKVSYLSGISFKQWETGF